MEALTIGTTTINRTKISDIRLCDFGKIKNIGFRTKFRRNVCVSSSNNSNNNNNNNNNNDFNSNNNVGFDKWDQMELKFGQMMGEDPNLTLAKIMGRKLDPHVSYLEMEKSFYKKKGKSRVIEEVPFDGSDEKKKSNSLSGLNLVRPVPKKGVKFEVDNKPIKPRIKVPSELVRKPVNPRGNVPNVILRKPTLFSEDDIGLKKPSKFSIKPNLLLRMGKEQTKENFTDMTLLKKPEPMIRNSDLEKEDLPGKTQAEATNDLTYLTERPQLKYVEPEPIIRNSDLEEEEMSGETQAESTDDLTYLTERPQLKHIIIDNNDSLSSINGLIENLESTNLSTDSADRSIYADPEVGPQQSDVESDEKPSVLLIGKPNRLDQTAKGAGNLAKEQSGNTVRYESSTISSHIKEFEENDWRRVEDLITTSGRDDVELVSASTRGFVVSLGSLIGFLPYRNLSPRWKFLAFESWLRKKGLDPSKYKQTLSIIGNNGILSESAVDSESGVEIDEKVDPEITPYMGLDDLLRIYDQEKLKFLSSFVGQKMKVNVTIADRKTRRLIFSLKPKEKEEMVDKKRTLMAKLSVGDVVKCEIKKITYFGIFVEVEGVPALIHQTEVSWDATLDPASYFKVGQIVEAKVHQLDFSLGRIFLSLKEITPDPLIKALEAVIGDKDYLDGRLEPAQDDEEWVDVESLIKELQQFEGIESVSKGRFFLSPGLAPTFQVYMASMFENEYKLLARAGNKVQEVLVQTSLGKEDMKSAILTCTNRVG